MNRTRLTNLGGLVALILACGFGGALWATAPRDPQFGWDLSAYLDAADRLRQGLPLYPLAGNAAVTPGAIGHGEFFNAPPVALLFLPLEALPRSVAGLAWYAVLTVTALALVAMLAREHGPSSRPWVIAATVAFLPLISELRYGNLNLVSIFLALVAWHFRARPRLAGMVLGVAIILKLLPLLILVFLAVAGRRRMTVTAVLTVGAFVILTIPWLGQAWLDYISVLRGLGRGVPAGTNAIPQPLGAFPWRYVLPVLAVALAAWAGRLAQRAPAAESTSFRLALAAAPLIATTIWYTYFIAALPLLLDRGRIPGRPPLRATGRARDYLADAAAWAAMETPFTAVPLAGLGLILATTVLRLRRAARSLTGRADPDGPPGAAPPILAAR